jgi:hypothetical protein
LQNVKLLYEYNGRLCSDEQSGQSPFNQLRLKPSALHFRAVWAFVPDQLASVLAGYTPGRHSRPATIFVFLMVNQIIFQNF